MFSLEMTMAMLLKPNPKSKGSLKILKSKLELDFQMATSSVFIETNGNKNKNTLRSSFIENAKDPCYSNFITFLISGAESHQLHHRFLHSGPNPPVSSRNLIVSDLNPRVLGPPSRGGVVSRSHEDDIIGHLSDISKSPGNSLNPPEPPTPGADMTIEAGISKVAPGMLESAGRDLIAAATVFELVQELENVTNSLSAGGPGITLRVPEEVVVEPRRWHISAASSRRKLSTVLRSGNCFSDPIGRALAGPSSPGPGKLKRRLTITLITVTDSGLPIGEACHWPNTELISNADVNTENPSQVETNRERPDTQVCNKTVQNFEPGDWRCCLEHSPLASEEGPGIRVKMSLLTTMRIGGMISALIRAAEIA